jgi:hypothetical protein
MLLPTLLKEGKLKGHKLLVIVAMPLTIYIEIAHQNLNIKIINIKGTQQVKARMLQIYL